MLTGLALAVALRGMSRLVGAALAAMVGLTLLAFNGTWLFPWEALSILALMFTGTMLYRAEQGQYPWRKAIPIAVAVLGMAIAAGLWHHHPAASAHANFIWDRCYFMSLFVGRPDVRGRHGSARRSLAARAELAGADQLLGVPAAPAADRGLPPPVVDVA